MKMLQHVQRCLLLTVVVLACAAGAQGKEQWVPDDWFEVSGDIVAVSQNGRQQELLVRSAVEHWRVRLGEPWRNRRAGLDDEALAAGHRITVYGRRTTNKDERLMKALRVVIDGRNHDLYPGQIR